MTDAPPAGVATPIIVALDFDTPTAAQDLARRLDPRRCRLKVGKELFTRGGPELVRELVADGWEVFLDLKFHDIPHTTAAAVRAAADLGVWMVNVHASGGPAMLAAARAALVPLGARAPLLTAVTVLTSMDRSQLAAVGVDAEPETQVLRLARLARQHALDGVVCSPRETALLRAELGADFKLVTPGIRPADAEQGDQLRTATPGAALANGSDYLVIGRPITRSDDPLGSLSGIEQEIIHRNA